MKPAPATQPALAIVYGPYLQAPAADGMTICWMTNRKCVSRVEYAEGDSEQYVTAISSHFGLIDADKTYHAVRLSNLKPATSYTYRVVSKEMVEFQAYKVVFGQTVCSGPARFTTLDLRKQRSSFIVLNDRHEKIDELKAALAGVDFKDLDLVFYNGDMVNSATGVQQVMRCVVAPSAFANVIPFIYVRGNHDTRGPGARSLMNWFPTQSGRLYYSFDHAGVHFVVLDCGEDKRDSDREYFGLVNFRPYMAEEARWLKEEVRSEAFRRAKFRVVIVHIPPYVSGEPKFAQGEWIIDNFCPLLEEAGADLMLCGHLHVFAEYAPQPPLRSYPLILGGTETVIRVNITGDELEVCSLRDDGTAMRSPLKIRRK